MNTNDIISEVYEKYGEYIEMAEEPSAITCNFLAMLLLKERQKVEYLEKSIKTQTRLQNVKY